MKTLIAIISIVFFLLGCDFIDKKQVERSNDKSPFSNTYTTRSGKQIHLKETQPKGEILSNVSIRSQGFENEMNETLKEIDPISNVVVADLDSNGFDEIYIFTTSAGSGSYGGIIGYASNHDKSLSLIYLSKIDELGHANRMLFKGYRGHDKFYIESNNLIREFPIYTESDTNAKPSGETQKILYRLYAGEAGWILKIE